MEDYKIILYILAAVAYFLFNTWRKAFKSGEEATPPTEQLPRPRPVADQPVRPVSQRPSVPPTSFEDILRELQPKVERAKKESEATMEMPVAEAKLEPTTSKYDKPQRVLSLENPEEAREAAKRAQQRRVPEFLAYAPKPVVKENKYAALLRNPTTVREAVILSEILKTKF